MHFKQKLTLTLFRAETVHWICKRRFDRLKTNRYQCYHQGKQRSENKYTRSDLYPVTIFRKPVLQEIVSQRGSDQTTYKNQQNKVLRQKYPDLRDRTSQNFAHPDLF